MSDYRLYPCPSCYRHVQPSSALCPFCGAALPPPPPAPPPAPAEVAELRGEVTIYGAPAPPPRELGEPMPLYGGPPPPFHPFHQRGGAARRTVLILLGLTVLAAIGWLVLSRLARVI